LVEPCKGRLLLAKPNQYFVSHGFTPDLLADWRQALEEGLNQSGGESSALQPYFSGDTLLSGFRLCSICEQLYTSRFSMFLLPPSQDRNVYLELGISIGLGVPFLALPKLLCKDTVKFSIYRIKNTTKNS
jgi:hypothetical protein